MDTMKAKTRKPLGQFLNDNSSVIAVLLLILLGTAAYGTTFLNYKKNLINVLHTASMMGIMGLGVNLCFLIGARDLSVGALAALVSMVTAWLAPYGFPVAVAGGLTVGAIFGAFNGVIVSMFKVQPFIATLGTQLAARGFALLINKELSISLGTNAPQLKYVGNGNVFGLIPFPTFAFIILILVLTVILRKKDFGRGVYALCGNDGDSRESDQDYRVHHQRADGGVQRYHSLRASERGTAHGLRGLGNDHHGRGGAGRHVRARRHRKDPRRVPGLPVRDVYHQPDQLKRTYQRVLEGHYHRRGAADRGAGSGVFGQAEGESKTFQEGRGVRS